MRLLHVPELYSCAVMLNRFLVALLFHYLIGKRVSSPYYISTPPYWSGVKCLYLTTNSEPNYVIFLMHYLYLCVRISCLTDPQHEILFASRTGRVWMFSTLSLTLHILLIFHTVMLILTAAPNISFCHYWLEKQPVLVVSITLFLLQETLSAFRTEKKNWVAFSIVPKLCFYC